MQVQESSAKQVVAQQRLSHQPACSSKSKFGSLASHISTACSMCVSCLWLQVGFVDFTFTFSAGLHSHLTENSICEIVCQYVPAASWSDAGVLASPLA